MGEERDRLCAAHKPRYAVFSDDEQRLPRTIPVMRLTPRSVRS